MNPVKTDINFTINQTGGLSKNILEHLKSNYQYLKTDNGLHFKTNNKNKETNVNFKYLGAGTFTVVVGIEYVNFIGTNNPKNWDNKYNDKLILRITEESSSILIENNYKIDKPIFRDNLLDIYLYGKLKINGVEKYYYTITREYNTNLNELNIYNKIKFIKSYFNVLLIANHYNIFYRDSKYENVGYDLSGNECIFIILDYDEDTLVNIDTYSIDTKQTFFHGTFPTYYALTHIYENRDNKKDLVRTHYDKLYISGMLDILNYVLFSNNNIDIFLRECSKFIRLINNKSLHFSKIAKFEDIVQKKNTINIDMYNKSSLNISEINLTNIEQIILDLFKFFIKDLIYDSIQDKYKDIKGIELIKDKLKCIDNMFIPIINIIENNELSKDIPINIKELIN